ncbi:MAG: Thiamine pyrophosphate-requiring protein PA2108 [uncultured Segetibacter sp.]|uniref:Thiamine pyrophosphate-requiring protein PA2108 n=1 Tax=uncultured Segetibacter sp. TaxID=481133 RepID=A0A6J4SY50_9BACT|nr:MAG: Thiamine pyrophosphate-requiring protein PA2108 [uncultured Segetibacter sp.]
MSKTVGKFIIDRLTAWGVKRVFGYPGDGINGILGGLRSSADQVEFIQVRHEEMAAFMACGHAKFTGEVGVCMATSGPGAIHLLNGLYDAKLDHQPVVAIVGQQARAALGGHYQQEVDLLSLFKDVANDFVQMCVDPSQIRHLVDRAIRVALAKRTVTCIIVPNDVQELKYEEPAREHGTIHSSIGYAFPSLLPANADLQKAADILNAGKKVAILVGAGALGAADEVIEVAEMLGAGVAKALLGKAVLPDDLPYVTGSIGLLGTKPSWDLMTECDTLLMIGSSFPYSEYLPKEGKARGVQIDIDGTMLGLRYPMEVHLQGDSKETLRALIPMLARKKDRNWQQQIENEVAQWWKVLEARSMNSANPVNPQAVFWELSKRLTNDSIICGDSGSSTFWYARDLKIKKGMKASLSGTLATMCSAVPYAIAAKFAFSDRMVVAVSGDGAMQMLGINELITIAKYWRQWRTPQLIIVVVNNQDLNMVTWEQRALAGDKKFEASQNIPDFPYARYAQMIGLEGIRIDKPEQIVSAFDRAMLADKPVIVEAVTDPNVPLLPPHVNPGHAAKFFTALFKGDSEAANMVKQTYKEVADNYKTH